jgi:hypothetical protein
LVFSFVLDYTIRKAQANQERLEMNGTPQFLVYADEINNLGENTNATKRNREALLEDSSREVSLEIKAKTKYRVASRHQNAGQNHNFLMHNKFFENVAKLKFVETKVTNENCIQEEIKSKLNLGNACFHSLQNFCLPVSFLRI